MSIENLIKLKSQQSFAERLAKTLTDDETFALLSGDSGSGRTTMCEQVVNSVDGKCLPLFIPCRRDLTLENLRELFLQQLLPSQEWELSNTLADTLVTLHIPTPQKVLVVVDDLDTVVSTFFDELLQIAHDFQGQNRFSILTTGHPLWAQGKLEENKTEDLLSEWQMPLVPMEEAMNISRAMFNAQGLLPVYKEINGKLPYRLEQCQGNIGKILKLTELLMAKPDKIDDQNMALDEAVNLETGSKKKRSTVVIFITVICLVIALACMVPLFLGGNIFKGIFGGTSDPVVTTQVAAHDGDTPQGIDPFGEDGDTEDEGSDDEPGEDESVEPENPEHPAAKTGNSTRHKPQGQKAQGSKGAKSTNHAAEDDTAALDSILADEQHGTEAEPVSDSGDLLPEVNGGVEAESSAEPKNSVTLSGEALEQIEKQGAGSRESDRPRRDLDGSIDNKTNRSEPEAEQKPAPVPAAQSKNETEVVVLKRADNALRMAERQKAAEEAQKAAEEAQKAAAEEQRAAAQKREAEEIAKAEERIRQEEAEKKNNATAVVKLPAPVQPAAQKSSKSERPRNNAGTAAGRANSEPAGNASRSAAQNNAETQSTRATVYARNVSASGSAVPGSVADIAAKPRDHYTLQVVASRDRAAVTDVASALNGTYWIYETVRDSRPWFVLITGDYSSAQEAMRAIRNLPRSLRGAGPFAKSFGTVRSEIAAQ